VEVAAQRLMISNSPNYEPTKIRNAPQSELPELTGDRIVIKLF
jgi:hypothetical protein